MKRVEEVNEKAIIYHQWGDETNLSFATLSPSKGINPESYELKKGYILARVKAISINPVDWKILSGSERPITLSRFPRVFGTDFAGEVLRTHKTSKFRKGSRVFGMVSPLNKGSGRQYLVVKEKHCLEIPPSFSYEDAASLPAAAISAFLACKPLFQKKPGNVLLLGASGGVGSLASQILSSRGWEVTAVAREHQFDLLKKRGCHTLLHRETWKDSIAYDWDAIIDCPGILIRSNPGKFLTKGGVYSPVYIPNSSIVSQIFRILLWYFTSRRTSLLLAYPSKKRLKQLNHLLNERILSPLIDSVWESKKVSQSVRKSKEGGLLGKIIIRIE